MPPKRTGYSSYVDHYAKYGKAFRRIKMPGLPKRPFRFQIRTLLRHDLIRGGKSPWWLTVHRRGIAHAKIGVNQLEARAAPHSMVKGYLTERILYAALVNLMHFVPGVDFIFQSSQDGGRLEMGGLVADFLFPILRIVINPLGPQHYQFRNMAKDEEQTAILADMGYEAYLVDEEVMYDEYALEEFLRRVFGGMTSGGADQGGHPAMTDTNFEQDQYQYDELYNDTVALQTEIYTIFDQV